MDGVAGTVENMVYRRVLAGYIVIDNPKQFANFAQEVCNGDSLFLPDESLVEEPEQIKHAKPIPRGISLRKKCTRFLRF